VIRGFSDFDFDFELPTPHDFLDDVIPKYGYK